MICWGPPWAPTLLTNPGVGGLGDFGGSPASDRSASQQPKASPSAWGTYGEAGLWGGGPRHVLQTTPSPGSESLSPIFLGWGFPSHRGQPWAPQPCPRHPLPVHTQANRHQGGLCGGECPAAEPKASTKIEETGRAFGQGHGPSEGASTSCGEMGLPETGCCIVRAEAAGLHRATAGVTGALQHALLPAQPYSPRICAQSSNICWVFPYV